MNSPLQPGAHLDADQLSAFAEGLLPEHERVMVLAHTAECAHCREIAFLAGEAVPVVAPAAESAPWWQALRHWGSQPWMLGGAGALVAAALLMGVFVWNRPGPAAPGSVTTALSNMPEPVAQQRLDRQSEQIPAMDAPPPAALRSAPMPSAPPSPSAGTQQAVAQPQAPQAVATPPDAAPMMSMSPTPVPAAAKMANASSQPAASRSEMPDKATYSMAAPPPPRAPAGSVGAAQPELAANTSAAPVENAQVQQLPLDARNKAPLRAAKARVREAAGGPLHLQIEHDAGPNNGLARLAGTVLDPSGATIPGALVRLSQPAATAVSQTVTDAAGRFTLPSVTAGQYQMQVSAQGFAAITQNVDLMSRDVAQADAVLPPGAMTEAVEVSADSAMVTDAAVSGKRIQGDRDALPGGLPIVSTVSSGDRRVALDTAGGVFARHKGRRWKQVTPRWSDKVVKLETGDTASEAASDAKKAGAAVFQITTAAGAIWVSADGEHWVRR